MNTTYAMAEDTGVADAFDRIAADLTRAGRERGLKVTQHSTMMVSQAGISFVGATLEGVELCGADKLDEGIDFGFVSIDAPSGSIPKGSYILRLNAEVPKYPGPIPARASLLDRNGKAVARATGTLDVESLEVDPDETARAMIMARIDFEAELSPNRIGQAALLLGVWCKKNGMHGDGFTFQVETTGR